MIPAFAANYFQLDESPGPPALHVDHGSTSLTRYGCPQTIAPLRVNAKDKKLCDKTVYNRNVSKGVCPGIVLVAQDANNSKHILSFDDLLSLAVTASRRALCLNDAEMVGRHRNAGF